MRKCIVNVAVTDLRREPTSSPKWKGDNDLLQESQLLFGEKVIVKEERNGWALVEALEQMKAFPDGSWQGYPGWIQSHHLFPVEEYPLTNYVVTDLWAPLYVEQSLQSRQLMSFSFGTRLQCKHTARVDWLEVVLTSGINGFLPISAVCNNALNVIGSGKKFLGMPYLWGGKSAYDPQLREPYTSVDCSGLVHLIYSVHGLNLPRDAHDQFLKCSKCQVSDLKEGDLVFSAPVKNPEKMTHVMLYCGNDSLLESTQSFGYVRITSGKKLWGKPLQDIQWGETLGDICLYMGKINLKGLVPQHR